MGDIVDLDKARPSKPLPKLYQEVWEMPRRGWSLWTLLLGGLAITALIIMVGLGAYLDGP